MTMLSPAFPLSWHSELIDGTHTAFVAEMMYILAQPTFDKYMALSIKGAGGTSRSAEDSAIKKSLEAKLKSYAEVEKTYTDIIQTGDGVWGLAALVKLGQVYENMGDSLKNSTIPFYLDADQKDMYHMQLEDKAYPQTEKAVAAYSAALGKAAHVIPNREPHKMEGLTDLLADNTLEELQQLARAGLRSVRDALGTLHD